MTVKEFRDILKSFPEDQEIAVYDGWGQKVPALLIRQLTDPPWDNKGNEVLVVVPSRLQIFEGEKI